MSLEKIAHVCIDLFGQGKPIYQSKVPLHPEFTHCPHILLPQRVFFVASVQAVGAGGNGSSPAASGCPIYVSALHFCDCDPSLRYAFALTRSPLAHASVSTLNVSLMATFSVLHNSYPSVPVMPVWTHQVMSMGSRQRRLFTGFGFMPLLPNKAAGYLGGSTGHPEKQPCWRLCSESSELLVFHCLPLTLGSTTDYGMCYSLPALTVCFVTLPAPPDLCLLP